MEQPAFPMISSDRCDNLRWKGMFVDSDADTPSGSDHLYWCLKTQLALGPDGQVVGKYECSAGRNCYKPL